ECTNVAADVEERSRLGRKPVQGVRPGPCPNHQPALPRTPARKPLSFAGTPPKTVRPTEIVPATSSKKSKILRGRDGRNRLVPGFAVLCLAPLTGLVGNVLFRQMAKYLTAGGSDPCG